MIAYACTDKTDSKYSKKKKKKTIAQLIKILFYIIFYCTCTVKYVNANNNILSLAILKQ